MKAQTVLKIDRVGSTMVTAIGYDPIAKRQLGDISIAFDQDGVRRVIADLCRAAGLPEPGTKG